MMRSLIVLLALTACSDSVEGPGLVQDGTGGVDLVQVDSAPALEIGEECPACTSIDPFAPPVEGVITVDLGESAGYPMRFAAELWINVYPDGERMNVTIRAMHRETGEVIGEPYDAQSKIVDGVVSLTWDGVVMPVNTIPHHGTPIELTAAIQLDGCLGRLMAMCGAAAGRFSETGEMQTGWVWGMADEPCPATCQP